MLDPVKMFKIVAKFLKLNDKKIADVMEKCQGSI